MTSLTDAQTPARPCQQLSSDDLCAMLSSMMLIRRFEERTAQSYQQAKIGGFCHLYIGQEAVAVGSIRALRDDDPIITAYRDHGHALARGMDPRHAMAEMFGRIDGCCKGKGGSMHLFDKRRHMFGGHAIVGGQLPLGVGLAFAIQYRGQDKVAVCYFGDGAINAGSFHESMNLAALWNLPIIFVCENNRYSMGTAIARGTTQAAALHKKAEAYGMRFASCDGMDVLAVFDCFTQQAAAVRDGQGPVFIEADCYRYKGHSMSDPQKYRSKDEVGEYEQQDPINRLVNHLIDAGLASQDQLDRLDKVAKQQALEAVTFAQDSPATPANEMFTDVYNQPFAPYTRGELPAMYRVEDGTDLDR